MRKKLDTSLTYGKIAQLPEFHDIKLYLLAKLLWMPASGSSLKKAKVTKSTTVPNSPPKQNYNYSHQFPCEAPDTDLHVFLTGFDLTEREQQIVCLICKGQDNQTVSDELFVSIQTVKHHVTAIFRKMDVRNRIQLANLISNVSCEMKRNAP